MALQIFLRRFRAAPTLLLAALLVAACATTPTRNPAPISSGEPREPVVIDTRPPDLPDIGPRPEPVEALQRGPLTPPHMEGRDITRAAVLLPFSHPNRQVRSEAQGILAAVELALFERGDGDFVIIPKDTAGSRATAESETEIALQEGAAVVLGPLFSRNVQAVRPLALSEEVPVIAFSNDPSAAGGGAYLAALAVEEEVAAVVNYALDQGVERFVFLGPRNDYGVRAERALRATVAQRGAGVLMTQFYAPETESPTAEAETVAGVLKAELEIRPGKVALLLPEDGVRLRAVAPLIPYYGVDFRKLRFLGTSRWGENTNALREPTLNGAWFAAPPPEDLDEFAGKYRRVYGQSPSALASLGYDAAAVAMALSRAGRLDYGGITNPDGFRGVSGLFRFRPSGTAERRLSVYEVDLREGATLVQRGAASFDEVVG